MSIETISVSVPKHTLDLGHLSLTRIQLMKARMAPGPCFQARIAHRKRPMKTAPRPPTGAHGVDATQARA
ncbi:hypothetical protein FRC11_013916, partial [Ceratobasidium sp. 423]